MRIALIVLAIVVVLALGAWGVTRVVANVVSNGPIADILGKHGPIKNIVEHHGLPTIGPPPGSATSCATPGTTTPSTGPPIVGCGPQSGTPGSGPPGGPPPGGGPPGLGPPPR